MTLQWARLLDDSNLSKEIEQVCCNQTPHIQFTNVYTSPMSVSLLQAENITAFGDDRSALRHACAGVRP